ncbi:hypothetical protein RDI58_022305 [Solanum bulbocastanum]|uniref:Ubiquitin-like protease family profile domain-containing protein n=1 Tax=Solanum bulbocastanum TaxID=147425 RepID=A0AAN8T7K0_SOLBU
MSSYRTNRKLCVEIQKLSTMLPKYLESSRFFEKKRPNQLVSSIILLGQEKISPIRSHTCYCDCGVFVAAYAEFLSDGLQIPFDGIISLPSLEICFTHMELWDFKGSEWLC